MTPVFISSLHYYCSEKLQPARSHSSPVGNIPVLEILYYTKTSIENLLQKSHSETQYSGFSPILGKTLTVATACEHWL